MELEDRDTWLQERYARWLDASTKLAFLVTVASFFVYVSGALPSFIRLEELPRLWGLPLDQYLARTGAPTGWEWLRLVGYGDYLNYLGICLFALVILICHAAIAPRLIARGERLIFLLAVAQVLVLLVAASGVFAGG